MEGFFATWRISAGVSLPAHLPEVEVGVSTDSGVHQYRSLCLVADLALKLDPKSKGGFLKGTPAFSLSGH